MMHLECPTTRLSSIRHKDTFQAESCKIKKKISWCIIVTIKLKSIQKSSISWSRARQDPKSIDFDWNLNRKRRFPSPGRRRIPNRLILMEISTENNVSLVPGSPGSKIERFKLTSQQKRRFPGPGRPWIPKSSTFNWNLNRSRRFLVLGAPGPQIDHFKLKSDQKLTIS